MPKQKKMGVNPPMPNYTRAPQDPTRAVQNMSYPPDQSIYSNPITSNQTSSMTRSPSTLQVGSLPNMQIANANSLPISQSPATTPEINPVTNQ